MRAAAAQYQANGSQRAAALIMPLNVVEPPVGLKVRMDVAPVLLLMILPPLPGE